MFIANNLQALYNAGVRYIFFEGGSYPVYTPDSDEPYYFLMFYPWMHSGWRYETLAMDQAVYDFNAALPLDDRIKLLPAEKATPDYITSFEQQWNFRDSSATETILNIMDSVSDETKAIILYGSNHTNIFPYRWFKHPSFNERFTWIPFGYLLKKHYGDNYASYRFVTDDQRGFLFNQSELLSEPKLVLLKNIPFINIPLQKNIIDIVTRLTKMPDNFSGHDGYIVEPEKIQGTFYQYNPTDENLSLMFRIVEDYALESKPDSNYIPFEPGNEILLGLNFLKSLLGENFDYNSPRTSYMLHELHGQFMMSLYYLKMHFGENFDYAFWKTEPSKDLLTALSELKEFAFTNNAPSEHIQSNVDSITMRMYHRYMNLSNVELFNIQLITGDAIIEEYLLEANQMFPEDMWPLYWLGFLAAEKKQWEKGLTYFQELFENDLAFFMESIPLAYQKAALCAEQLGNSRLADEYNYIAAALYNDYNIIVHENRVSFVGYFNGSWLYTDLQLQ